MLAPDIIQDLVTIAFSLEPLADKEGCTTRSVDLPDKPLTSFIIAGIASGQYFRRQAEDLRVDPQTPIFKYYTQALESSKRYGERKIINFGLLEIMFPTVAARLVCDDASQVIPKMIEIMKQPSQEDVSNLINARMLAWATSRDQEKKSFSGAELQSVGSPWDLYGELSKFYPGIVSARQWAEQYDQELPIIRDTVERLRQQADILETVKSVYLDYRKQQPDLKIGIIADMCAAGLFLYLSFLPSYER